MLTKLTVRNFKRFGELEIELGNPVAFIGPNNSGKTSAMQALALWDIGLKRWKRKEVWANRSGEAAGGYRESKRPGGYPRTQRKATVARSARQGHAEVRGASDDPERAN